MSFILRSLVRIVLLFFVSVTIVSVSTVSARATTNIKQKTIAYNRHIPSLVSNTQSNLSVPNFSDRSVSTSPPCIPVCGTGNLVYGHYGNGPVQLQPKAYLIFWGPYWTTTTGKAVAT